MMKADIAIIKLTIVTIIRSAYFIIISLVTAAFGIIIPLTLQGDGGAVSLFQTRIDYALGTCSLLIFLSAVWSGCSIITTDIETYKLHMLVVKPVGKYRIWLSRFLGVVIIHFLLLALVSFIIYLTISIVFASSALSPQDKTEVNEKVFTGRKNYISRTGSIDEEIAQNLAVKIKESEEKGETLSESEQFELKKKTVYTLISRKGEVKPGESKTFVFDITKAKLSDNASFGFMLYIGSPDIFAMQNRPIVKGSWNLQVNNEAQVSLSNAETFLSNEKYEINTSLKGLRNGENVIKLTYRNLDKDRSVFFRITESPQIQIKCASFFENYLRYLLIITLGIFLLSAIGCALGGILSFPVAVFVIMAYLLFGSLGNFILSGNEVFQKDSDLQLKIGYSLSKNFLKVITPVQKFQLSDYVASGMLIENSLILETMEKYFLVQFLVMLAAGIYIFSKREFGMVIKR